MAAESHQDVGSDVTSIHEAPEAKVATPPSEIVKQYESQGQWTLHRLASPYDFLCFQCNKRKKAEPVAICKG
ncbi:hypothetical protein BU23DRAFT_562262 [Bimuria novae-zelandiae CBS 107.79]|uniref:Uncharacterized protein n=1 Tax=Bimuria novae-zelandiae CBS 107.79 TaxID=1447943 RepID=A0A6A5UIA7_9PLEO|nr:hypothetical protein BU23DRAFT_562262 [Bimuria novae-zelandiae CBS 107.79]